MIDEIEWKHAVIGSREDLKNWLRYEKTKYSNTTSLGEVFPITEQDYVWKYQKRLRVTEYYRNTNKKIRFWVSKSILVRLSIKYGMNIRVNSCGKGLKIMHVGSILTNGDIGEDCSIHINALVVAGGSSEEVPIIGNNVIIGVGAVVVGKAIIPNGCAVGANAVVNKEFDSSNTTLAGIPAKIISRQGSQKWRTKKD